MSAAERDEPPLGARLQGVQHFGLTVQNMDRAYEFYTEVLGGTEVMRDGDFQGERIQNTLLTDQEIEANARGGQSAHDRRARPARRRAAARRALHPVRQCGDRAAAISRRRSADGQSDSFAEPREHMSPAYPRMMHICFHIRDDVDFNKFIPDLEAESARRGMTQVKANRMIRVMLEAERLAAPRSANTNRITEGQSNGWALIYCKGPEGEQLEFVKALGPVKQRFNDALTKRQQIVR